MTSCHASPTFSGQVCPIIQQLVKGGPGLDNKVDEVGEESRYRAREVDEVDKVDQVSYSSSASGSRTERDAGSCGLGQRHQSRYPWGTTERIPNRGKCSISS